MTRICPRWIFAFCFFVGSGVAQTADRNITLDVVVSDKAGKPVSGLQEQEFTLLDNKQPQKILSFRAIEGVTATPDPPVEVILLTDEVNTSFQNVARERYQIEKFLGQNGGQLAWPVSLVFFSDSGTKMGTAATRDGKTLIAALNANQNVLRTSRRSQGFYGADDRLQLSLRALQQLTEYERTRPGRKLLVWISPGWAYLSGPNVQLSSKDQQGIFNTVVGLANGLRQARITLFSVDPLGTADAVGVRTTYYESFLKGVKKADKVQIGNLSLQVLADQSGGLVLNGSNDAAGEIAKCVADASAYYELAFAGLPGDGPNEYHALEVKVDKPGLKTRTHYGYYAQPEPVRPH